MVLILLIEIEQKGSQSPYSVVFLNNFGFRLAKEMPTIEKRQETTTADSGYASVGVYSNFDSRMRQPKSIYDLRGLDSAGGSSSIKVSNMFSDKASFLSRSSVMSSLFATRSAKALQQPKRMMAEYRLNKEEFLHNVQQNYHELITADCYNVFKRKQRMLTSGSNSVSLIDVVSTPKEQQAMSNRLMPYGHRGKSSENIEVISGRVLEDAERQSYSYLTKRELPQLENLSENTRSQERIIIFD